MDKKQSKIRVVIRVRPTLKVEDSSCLRVVDNSVEIFNHRNIQENIKYRFARVHDETCSQLNIYNENVRPMLNKILTGQNMSVFAYGPTGAGKTHTMLGSPTDPGIIPRVVNGIFQLIQEDSSSEWDYSLSFSFLEIYNEKVQDLLEPKNTDLPIREDGEKNIFVSGLAERVITDFDEFKKLFGAAASNRTVAATKLNDRSSRSHSIIMLKAKKVQKCAPHKEYHGKLYLIDLAGSEDNKRTGNIGIRLRESGAINKSLFALGEVVDAINSGQARIPYRNSKLTRLLQDSIGGSCHAVMITNIAPEERFYYDTYCTLNMATKSKKITNTTCVREVVPAEVKPSLKRPMSDGRLDVTRKRLKLSPRTTPPGPPKEYNPAPFLSPLLRRQANLEDTVNQRLGMLEENLLKQMKAEHSLVEDKGSDVKVTVKKLEEQLRNTTKQLQMLKKQQTSNVLKDTTNIPNEQKKTLKKPKLEKIKTPPPFSPVTCEALFFKPEKRSKKGFVSTACRPSADENFETPTKVKIDEGWKVHINSDTQQKHNESILKVINTGSMKDLQMLQTVGKKRAQLILAYRETNGPYLKVEDLKLVPGLTAKYVENFQRSNLFSKLML
ncbi:kinesin-like protein KIF22-A [Liolophura sinensis]|uniref:kinesin-like protein KIF22-A n=1 Tax=Liolophura sinensis TaxID=3198878 RepID=UPI0031585B38